MTCPRLIFLDTSVFDSLGYDFEKTAARAFVAAAEKTGVTLLLPAGIEAEAKSHIALRAKEAHEALQGAGRKAPFLRKWSKWPLQGSEFSVGCELEELSHNELQKFLSLFHVERLDYSGVDVAEIMRWYEEKRPPFGDGKKRKEFPDAIALSSLLHFAEARAVHIAVVSGDDDFRKACDAQHSLHMFRSITAVTEALLNENARVEAIRHAASSAGKPLVEAIQREFTTLDFYPEEDISGEVSDVVVAQVQFGSLDVIGIGENSATVAFLADVEFSADVRYPDPDFFYRDPDDKELYCLRHYSGNVSDVAAVAGTAKMEISESGGIKAVLDVVLDTPSVDVRGRPDSHEDGDMF